jgi:hypothetical protein
MKAALKCANKARILANKRNDIVHNSWGLHEERQRIEVRKQPFAKHPSHHVPLGEIQSAVARARDLAEKIIELTEAIYGDASYSPSLDKQPSPKPAAPSAMQHLPAARPLGPKRRPPPSKG